MPPLDGRPRHLLFQHLTSQDMQNQLPSSSAFPDELTSRQQWLLWRFIQKPGQKKPAKMPYYASGELRGWPYGKPKDGQPTEDQPQVEQGHELDRAHLVTFDEAVERAALGDFDGVGFAFLPGDGLIGIDLDAACADKHEAIRDACETWAEVSPSGTGLHIIGLGETETFKSNDVGIEVFCGRQFFTMPGRHDEATPMEIRPIPVETLDKLRRTVEAAKEAARAAKEAAKPAAPAQARPVASASTEALRYCHHALQSAVQRVSTCPEGGRNDTLNLEAFGLGQLLHHGVLSEHSVMAELLAAASCCGLPQGEAASTIRSGLRAGQEKPRALPELKRAAATGAPRATTGAAPAIDPETGEILATPEAANDNAPPQSLPNPIDVFAEFPAPPIEPDMLPDVIADYAAECGQLIGVDPAMVAIPALVSCAAALHDGVRIQPKRHETGWTESARLWCAIVGTPSVKKSPAIRRATKRLRKIDIDLAEENARKAAEHADQLEQFKEAKKEAKKTGASISAPERPTMNRMVVEDITIEALSEVLKDNARGVLCIQDELSGWFGSMDAYNGGKAGNKDRAAWLQAYNGGFRQVDRVMRGAVHIPNFSVSMIGGIQPDAIRRIAKDMTDDGLMQRFMIVIGRNAREHDRAENPEVGRQFADLVDHLHSVQPSENVVKLSEAAHRIREDLMAWAGELADYPALPGGLRSHLGKWSGLFARLLLVYHTIECQALRQHPCNREVSGDTAGRVDRLMRGFLMPHALAYYSDILGASGELEHARWVAGYILSRGLQDLTNRDLIQAYKQWRGMDDWRRQRTMQVLEDMGWITPVMDETRPTRRTATSWVVNPVVHDLFSARAEEEADRRGRLRAEVAAMQRRATA